MADLIAAAGRHLPLVIAWCSALLWAAARILSLTSANTDCRVNTLARRGGTRAVIQCSAQYSTRLAVWSGYSADFSVPSGRWEARLKADVTRWDRTLPPLGCCGRRVWWWCGTGPGGAVRISFSLRTPCAPQQQVSLLWSSNQSNGYATYSRLNLLPGRPTALFSLAGFDNTGIQVLSSRSASLW